MYKTVNYICQCCGEQKSQANGMILTVHHICPVRAGGLATKENGFVCCAKCHTKIHQYIDPLGDVGRNFWQDLANYLITLETITEDCYVVDWLMKRAEM